MNIVSQYPWWYYFLCILLSGVLAFLLYRKDKRLVEFSKIVVGILFAFRMLALSILFILLLSPLIKYFSKTVEKPIIVIAQDNSASMLMSKDSSFIQNELATQMDRIAEGLAENFEVNRFVFGEETTSFNETVSYDAKISNFEVLFDELDSRYANRNVGGLLLISDGIYNQGSNPVYQTGDLEFPVFPIAVGDTTRYIDARIENLKANKLAFLGNDFPVEFDVKLQQATPGTKKIAIKQNGTSVYNTDITVKQSNQTITVKALLTAKQVGKQKYTVVVEQFTNERNTVNNERSFYIDVLDGRQKVALLGSAPHPDLGAIKKSINTNENYEVSTAFIDDFKANVKDFDLIILHQSSVATDQFLNRKLQEIVKSKVPLLIIGGGWESLELQFGGKRASGREVRNEAQAIVNEQFNLFTIDEKLAKKMSAFPPLSVGNSNTFTAGNSNTLLYQKIGSVATKYPLLLFTTYNERKIGRLYGEGLWSWRIADYVENKSHKSTNQFISKIVQYLAVKSDRSFFRMTVEDEVFENENINFNAQLFNPSYELVNDAEVDLVLKDANDKQYDYTLNRTDKDYRLSISSLPPSNYRYEAKTTFQGKQLKARGSFTIKELQLEKLNAEANHNVLYQMAQKSGGELINPSELDGLLAKINDRKDIVAVSYINEEVEDIINLRWIFYIILALLSLEWFIRKRGGAY